MSEFEKYPDSGLGEPKLDLSETSDLRKTVEDYFFEKIGVGTGNLENEKRKYQQHLVRAGVEDIHWSWGPKAIDMTEQERFSYMNKIFSASIQRHVCLVAMCML